MGMKQTAAQEEIPLDELAEQGAQSDDAPEEHANESASGSEEQATGEDETLQNHEGDGESDEERERIRERRRAERQQKKQAVREREESFRREIAARDSIINEMRQRIDAVERRSTGADLANLDVSIKQAADAYTYYKDQIRAASEVGNHAGVAEAVEKMNFAQRRVEELSRVKNAYVQRSQQPQALDPRVLSHAQKWANDNSWYNPVGQSREDRIVRVLDEELASEGWSPTTSEYWEELDNRVRKYLPHRRPASYNSSGGSRSPVAGSGRESQTSPGSGFRLSPDRVKALKDAGIWDDAKKRAEAIKRFQQYDNAQRNGAAE